MRTAPDKKNALALYLFTTKISRLQEWRYFYLQTRCENHQFYIWSFLEHQHQRKDIFYTVLSLASNLKVIPVGCRSQSFGWSDVSAKLIVEQSARNERAFEGSLFSLFWNIWVLFNKIITWKCCKFEFI